MNDLETAKTELLRTAERFEEKRRLSDNVGDDYFEPGMMENLDQYSGYYNEDTGILVIRTDIKGLRYENRSLALDYLSAGDPIKVSRDKGNEYNPNNFRIDSMNGESLGNLPAEVCNALAVLYDAGCASIEKASVSYIEKLRDRSRYAVQGVLFAELQIKLN